MKEWKRKWKLLYWDFIGFRVQGLEGMEKKMETTIMGYIGTTVMVDSFIPSEPKAS